MDIKVFDLEHKERDFAYAEAKYGVAFRRAKVEPGQKVYRLTELWEKTGNSSLISKVVNEGGDPTANVDVAFYWPDAPDPPDPPTAVYDHDWYKRFKHGPTNKDGDVGPGMGPGAYHGEGEGGPHAVWVRDPTIPTDICEKLGMLAGTFHDHLDQKFQLMVEGGEPPPPSGTLVPEFVKTVKEPHGSTMLCIAVIADSEAAEKWLWDTRGMFKGPGGVYEETNPEDWVYPVTSERCSLVGGCCDFGSPDPNEQREFSIRLFRLPDRETILIGLHILDVYPMDQADKRRVVHVYRLVKKPGPEPPPPPPPPPEGDPAAMLRQLADAHRDDLYTLADKLKGGQVTGGTLTLTLDNGRQAQFSVAPTVQAQGVRKLWVAVKSYLGGR